MIYVTGDTHANIDIGKLNTKRFPQQLDLTKKDYLVICGDYIEKNIIPKSFILR